MSRLTSKGQVTIPKRLRDQLGLKAGSTVEFQYAGDGRITLKAAEDAKMRSEKLAKTQKERLRRALAALPCAGKFEMSTDELMRLTRGWGEPDYDVPTDVK
jgi:AbrB family looped-hinge helix DNA binding protein